MLGLGDANFSRHYTVAMPSAAPHNMEVHGCVSGPNYVVRTEVYEVLRGVILQ